MQAPALPNLLCDPVQVLPFVGLSFVICKMHVLFPEPILNTRGSCPSPTPQPHLGLNYHPSSPRSAGALRMKIFLEILSQQEAGSHQHGPASWTMEPVYTQARSFRITKTLSRTDDWAWEQRTGWRG